MIVHSYLSLQEGILYLCELTNVTQDVSCFINPINMHEYYSYQMF